MLLRFMGHDMAGGKRRLLALLALVVAAVGIGLLVRGVTRQREGTYQIGPCEWVVAAVDREQALAAPADLLAGITLKPRLEGGRVRGLEVTRVADASAFDRVGLRVGDLVVSVNGAPVDTLERSLGLFRELGASDEILVDVERGGERIRFRFEVKG